MEILHAGTQHASLIARQTIEEVRTHMGLQSRTIGGE